jgi:hypothetical protein
VIPWSIHGAPDNSREFPIIPEAIPEAFPRTPEAPDNSREFPIIPEAIPEAFPRTPEAPENSREFPRIPEVIRSSRGHPEVITKKKWSWA